MTTNSSHAVHLLNAGAAHCRRAGALVGKQAGQSLSSLKEGVQQGPEYITQRINSGLGYVQQGPRHVQTVFARLQKQIEETQLQHRLKVGYLEQTHL